MMKNLVIFTIFTTLFFGCNLKSQNDQKLAREVNFDMEIIELIRKETTSNFIRLRTEIIYVYPHGEEKQVLEPNAIEFEIEGENSLDMVFGLRSKL